MLTIADLMTRDVHTIGPTGSLMEIREMLRAKQFHHLPVVEDGHLLGVISDRDVLRTVSPFLDTSTESHRDVQTLGLTAREIMKDDPLTVEPSAPAKDAARLMLERGVSCLIVTEEDGAMCGIVTSRDLLRHLSDAESQDAA